MTKRKDDAADLPDLHDLGGRVVSVFGPFGHRTLIDVPTEVAEGMFPDGLVVSARTDVIDAALRDVERIRERDEQVADSLLAQLAVTLAYEVAHPYHSATSKAANAAQIRECITELEARLPPKQTADAVDDVGRKREQRRAAAREAGAAT